MTTEKPHVGYCGLLCSVCQPFTEGVCTGCRVGPADPGCHQRACCIEAGIEGCWDCVSFPCEEGYFGMEEWRGLCCGSVRAIRALGVEEFARRVRRTMGDVVDHGNWMFKTEPEILGLLSDKGS